MSRRARAMAHELAETEAQMDAINSALDNDQRRREIAKQLAQDKYGTEDVIFDPFDVGGSWPSNPIESRDGGYWVAAKVWIEADDVEDAFNKSPRQRMLLDRIAYHGEGRLDDMRDSGLDLENPDRFLLVQSCNSEPWFVTFDSPEEAAKYIAQDYPQWDFEELIDLDTGEEYDLDTTYVFKPARKMGEEIK